MIRRWFQRSNPLSDPDPKVRLEAIKGLTQPQATKQQAELSNLLANDTSVEIRLATLAFINSADVIVQHMDDPNIGYACATTLIQREQAGQTKVPVEFAEHPEVLNARLNLSTPQELVELSAKMEDPMLLADLALRLKGDHRDQVLNQPALQTERGLATLEKVSRGKDKQCNRFARDKLETIKKTKTLLAEQRQRIDELDTSIHKELKANPQSAEAVIAQRTKLKKLTTLRTEASNQLSALDPSADIPADPLADVDIYLPAPDNNPFDALCKELEALKAKIICSPAIEEIQPVQQDIARRWLTEADKFPPTTAQHEQFEAVSRLFNAYDSAWNRFQAQDWKSAYAETNGDKKWLQHWRAKIKQLNWPPDCALPEDITKLSAAIELTESTIRSDANQQKTFAQEAEQLLNTAAKAIDEGQTSAATKSLKAIRNLSQQTSLPAHLDKQLNTLSARLNELRDWQKFATSPKRSALVEQMQALAEAPKEPSSQSSQIRTLRNEWQVLGAPASAADRNLADQFNEWADKAYEPCKAYYEKQSEIRAANLTERQAICEQLKTYLTSTDWDTADLKAADSILRTARHAWREHHPCDRRALKPVEAEFESLQEQLHTHLKRGWDANIETRKQIIARAQELETQAVAEQVDQAKALQSEWRQVGPVPRGIDQKLWKEFRAACDSVFTRRDEIRSSEQAQKQNLVDALDQAIGALEEVVNQTPTPETFRQARDTVQAQLDALTEVMRPPQGQRRRIDAAEAAFAQQRRQARAEQAAERLQMLKAADLTISQAETDASVDQLDATTFDAMFAPRFSGEAAPVDYEQLVLTAEIASDIPSPADAGAARMALQVELMNQGKRSFEANELNDLVQTWCASGPKTQLDPALIERFFDAIQQGLSAAAAS